MGSKHRKADSVPVPMPVGDASHKVATVSRSNSDKQKRPSVDNGTGMNQGSSAEDMGATTV